ncbi:MAG TPA: hypothetical protein PLG50_13730, partial [bacterium]|nr:hypothetical protein [bacterium]
TLLALAWLYNLLLVAGTIQSLCQSPMDPRPWMAWAGKSMAELLLLIRFAKPMRRLQFLGIFPLAELLHVGYVVLFGALGPLSRIHWKENAASTAPAGA